MSVLLTLMIAGFAIGAWFVFNQQQELLASERERAGTEERVQQLESRARATDEDISDAGEETDEQLNFWESEIRKVWDVANKRNKKWIQDNQAAVTRHQSTLNSVEASLADIRSAVSRNDAKLQQQGEIIERLADVQEQVRTLVRQDRDLVDEVKILRHVVATLKPHWRKPHWSRASKISRKRSARSTVPDSERVPNGAGCARVSRRSNDSSTRASPRR